MYQDCLRNQSGKEIYQPGALRIVSMLLYYVTIRVKICMHTVFMAPIKSNLMVLSNIIFIIMNMTVLISQLLITRVSILMGT